MTLLLGILYAIAFVITKILEFIVFIKSLPYYFMKHKKCPPIHDEILLYTATEIGEKIRNREIKCEAVIRAYVSRIRAVNPIINAVVEDRFSEALNESRCIDEMLANTTLTTEELKIKYPLLGIPMTIKNSIAVKGMDHASGRVLPNGKKASKDARAVELIRKAGAVLLLVSNTPELCMALETFNNVTGKTNNPYDTRRTSGGSSGGEAALLGAGASLMGMGSDLVGSIRVPASFCGIFGHKPTPGAISIDGHYPDSREKHVWTSLLSVGPMCRYATDLLLLSKVVADKSLKLDEQVALQNLKYYIMENDGKSFLTHPVDNDITQAIRKFKLHLERKFGVKVQKLDLDAFSHVELTHLKVLSLTEIDTLFDKNGQSPYSELLRFITGRSKATYIPILQGLFNDLIMQLPEVVRSWPDYKLRKTKEKFLGVLGDDGVLLYPTHPKAAHIHGQMVGRYFDYHYTGIFNVLGVPATSCPIGLNSKGLPIGMQIAAAPNNDRLTLALAREVETVFGGWTPP